MSTTFKKAEDAFRRSVGDFRNLLAFLKVANYLRPKLGEVLNWNDWTTLDEHSKDLATQFMGQKDYNLEVGYNGMIVSIAASFEEFVRQLIREAVVEICRRVKTYQKLKKRFQELHLVSTGHALASLHNPPIESTYNYEKMCQNLGNCYSGTTSLTLNEDVFHSKLPGMNKESLDKAFERINVTLEWDDIGKNANLQAVLQLEGARDTAKGAGEWLDDFAVQRNRIAHTGVSKFLVKLSDIEEAIAFFDVFTPALGDAVEIGLKRSLA